MTVKSSVAFSSILVNTRSQFDKINWSWKSVRPAFDPAVVSWCKTYGTHMKHVPKISQILLFYRGKTVKENRNYQYYYKQTFFSPFFCRRSDTNWRRFCGAKAASLAPTFNFPRLFSGIRGWRCYSLSYTSQICAWYGNKVQIESFTLSKAGFIDSKISTTIQFTNS